MILQDKTILVSGVGPGLGREIASRILRDGGRVVIGARKAESLEAAAKELDPSGERILAHAFDITDEAGCRAIIAAAEQQDWVPRASTVGLVAGLEYRSGKRDDLWKLNPLYYRRSAAEEKLVAGE